MLGIVENADFKFSGIRPKYEEIRTKLFFHTLLTTLSLFLDFNLYKKKWILRNIFYKTLEQDFVCKL